MKLNRCLIALCLWCATLPVWAGSVKFYVGPTGQTIYTRVQTASGTFVAAALTEGASGDAGNYYATDATVAALSGMSTPGTYSFTVRSGAPSTTATDPIVAQGRFKWTGTTEATSLADNRTAQRFAVVATAYKISATGINVTTDAIDSSGGDFVLVCANSLSAIAAPTLTDNYGNNYETSTTSTVNWIRQTIWKVPNPRVGSGHTFTITTAGASPSVTVIVTRGLRLADPYGPTASASGSGTTQQPGSVTPADNNSIIVQALTTGGTSAATINLSYTTTGGGTNVGGNGIGGSIAYLIQTTATASNPTWTTGSGYNIASAFVFKPQTAENRITVDNFAERRIFNRDHNGTAPLTTKRVAFSGTYAGEPPSNVYLRTFDYDTGQVRQEWQRIEGLACSGDTWSGVATLDGGGWYKFAAQGVDTDGRTLATSIHTGARLGVGINVAIVGQSNGVRMFQLFTSATADNLTSQFVAGAWTTNTGEGATTLANKLAAATNLPIGLINYGVSGAGLEYNAGSGKWHDTTPGAPYPTFEAGLAASGGDCEFVLFIGGEADCLNPSFSGPAFKAGLDWLYAQIQGDTGRTAATLRMGAGVMGTLNDGSSDANVTAVRLAEAEWNRATAGAFLPFVQTDIPRVDNYHYGGPGYTILAQRGAQSMLNVLGYVEAGDCEVRIINPWRVAGGTHVYLPVVGLAGDGLEEADATTDGGSLTGLALSNNDFSSTLTISSTAFLGDVIDVTLSAAPTGTVKVRNLHGAVPTISNLPYRGLHPQGGTIGLPVMPCELTVETRAAFADGQTVAKGELPIRLPRDIGFTLKSLAGATTQARQSANVSPVSQTNLAEVYSTYFTPPTGYDAGYVVWDNGTDTVEQVYGDVQVAAGGSGTADTRDLEPVQFTWTFSRRADGAMESTNTLVISPGETFRCGFKCEGTNVLPIGSVLASMTSPTVTNAACTATKLGIDPTMAKVEVTADDEATDGTKGYVRTTVVNNLEAGPVTLLGKFIIVEEPE